MQTLQAIRNIRHHARPTAGRSSGAKGQTKIHPLASCTNGFLNHSFLPLCEPERTIPKKEITEPQLLQSVTELYKINGIEPLEITHLAYPYNVLLAHHHITARLNRQPYETEVVITKSLEDDKITVATRQVFEYGHTLYYIPVIPLYHYLRNKQNKATGELLLAVLSYLYREAGVPHYREEDMFMSDEYEMVKSDHLECLAANPGEYEEDLFDIFRNEIIGDIMQRKMANPYHLRNLPDAIAKFKPQNQRDEECLYLAQETLALFQEFPGRNIWQNIPDEDEFADDDLAPAAAYVSFIGDEKGWVYETIERYMNEYLGNFSLQQQPTIINLYDGTANEPRTLEYEYRAFDLISNTAKILFDLP